MYASVVVNVENPGLRQPLTYTIPDAFDTFAIVGACVVVPLGNREAIGWIIGRPDTLPGDLAEDAVRPILGMVTGDGSHLPQSVLKTARWVSQTYFCDLATALRTTIPDGLLSHIVRRYALSEDWERHLAETNTQSHRELLLALSQFPGFAATEKELETAIGTRIVSPGSTFEKAGRDCRFVDGGIAETVGTNRKNGATVGQLGRCRGGRFEP